jgi:large subunit ribosomal protein L5
MKSQNPMRQIRIEKLTLNIGCGKDQQRLEKAMKLIKNITGKDPVKTVTHKRIAAWGLRPGLPIGCKLTLRGKEAEEVLRRLLAAKDNKLSNKNFDDFGNFSFGLEEYIDIPGVKYDPDVGMMGLQACVTLARPGYRIKYRRLRKSKIPKKHLITKSEAINYVSENFKVEVEGSKGKIEGEI